MHEASNEAEFYPEKKEKKTLDTIFCKDWPIFLTGRGELGVKLLSGENITIACKSSKINATLMQNGCHENKSDPGFAK